MCFFGYKNKNQKRKWYIETTKRKEQKVGSVFSLIQRLLGPAYTTIMVMSFLIVGLSYIAGLLVAFSKNNFFIFTNQKESVAIVRFYNERAIGKSYDPDTHLFTNNFYSIDNMGLYMTLAALGAFLGAAVLLITLQWFGDLSLRAGFHVGLLVWLGYVMVAQLDSVLWDGKSFRYFFINTVYSLVKFVGMGMILGAWLS